MKTPQRYDRPGRDCLGTYTLFYEPLDGDGRLFGLKAKLRHLLRQRPTSAAKGRGGVR